MALWTATPDLRRPRRIGILRIVLLSPDGRFFVWLGIRDLKVWDVATGFPLTSPGARTEPQVPALTAEFLDDGRLAYVADNRLIILTLPNGPIEERPVEPPVTEWSSDVGITTSQTYMAIRRDGRLIAGTDGSRTGLWDVVASKRRDLTAPALTDVRSLEWSRSGIVAWADYQVGGSRLERPVR